MTVIVSDPAGTGDSWRGLHVRCTRVCPISHAI